MRIVATFFTLILLAGCAADLERARDLTVGDGLLYVEQNHDFRRDLRSDYQDIVKSISERCKAASAAAQDVSDAIELTAQCFEFLEKHYPNLATLELLREGAQGVNELIPELQKLGE